MTKQTLGLCSLVLTLTTFFFTGSVLYGQGNTGQLKVKANPGRAGVFVDGKYLGPAANFAHARTYSVTAGEHELVLREPRYEDYKTNIKIDAGKTTTVSQGLQAHTLAKPSFGRLRVVGFEKFAPVYVNGMFMDTRMNSTPRDRDFC
jgi:hypothetical protein